MKVTIGELVKIQKSLSKIASATYLHPKTIYGAARAIRQIGQEFVIYNKERMKWFRELGEVIQIPNPKNPAEMINHPKGEKRIKPENVEKFEQLRDDFERITIELYDFNIFLSDIVKHNNETKDEKAKITVDEIADLLPWVVDDIPASDKSPVEKFPSEPAPTC